MNAALLICPVCGGALAEQGRSLCCEKGHCFDLAKEGYVNLLTGSKPADSMGDNKEAARFRRDFLNKGYYAPLRDALCARFAEQDKKRREEVETLNHADSLIYETEKTLRDNGDKLSDEDKNAVQAEIDSFKKVRESNNAGEIKNAMEGFTQKVYAVFGKLYQQQAGAAGDPMNGAGPQAGTNDDGSMNADGGMNANGSVE